MIGADDILLPCIGLRCFRLSCLQMSSFGLCRDEIARMRAFRHARMQAGMHAWTVFITFDE